MAERATNLEVGSRGGFAPNLRLALKVGRLHQNSIRASLSAALGPESPQ